MKNARILGILRCEALEVLGETAFAVSPRTSLHTMTEEMSAALPYDYKTLFEDSREELYFGTSYDRESFNFYDFKSIEWVKVKPCFEEHTRQGRLVGDKITYHNAETEFLTLMKKYSIPCEYDSVEEVYVTYGYK